jgi:hypothetical protein
MNKDNAYPVILNDHRPAGCKSYQIMYHIYMKFTRFKGVLQVPSLLIHYNKAPGPANIFTIADRDDNHNVYVFA